ncbi:hypothetical protein PZA20_06435 [Pectobacterium polaris]|uniref:hypothetical protein n=1 Tax=Pectobacterium polaris TaxID=2042057 RepID=UPI001582A5C6|nr:hypothetical protein [Pectobacterium polaris]MDE8741459.1 hypothetical protein [Pectobacterium polaris]
MTVKKSERGVGVYERTFYDANLSNDFFSVIKDHIDKTLSVIREKDGEIEWYQPSLMFHGVNGKNTVGVWIFASLKQN